MVHRLQRLPHTDLYVPVNEERIKNMTHNDIPSTAIPDWFLHAVRALQDTHR